VGAVALGVIAVGLPISISSGDSGGVPPQVIAVVAGPPAALGALFAFSSHYGFTNARACRAATRSRPSP